MPGAKSLLRVAAPCSAPPESAPGKPPCGPKNRTWIFLALAPKPRQEVAAQSLGTHQENSVCYYGIVSGCVVAPNSAGVLIALGYKEVMINTPLGNIPTGEYHTFVVATDLTTGDQIATRGGPTQNIPFGFGSIKGQTGTWDEGFIDPPSQTVVMQPVGTVSMTLDQVRGDMNNFQSVTQSNNISYSLSGPNSNSYAFTFVQSLGLSRPQPLQEFPVPGSNMGSPPPNLSYAPGP
jgi:hypothetical protein